MLEHFERIMSACERLRNCDGWQEHLKHGATLDDPTHWVGPLLHEIEDAAALGIEACQPEMLEDR